MLCQLLGFTKSDIPLLLSQISEAFYHQHQLFLSALRESAIDLGANN
jgi:hypothetical protein